MSLTAIITSRKSLFTYDHPRFPGGKIILYRIARAALLIALLAFTAATTRAQLPALRVHFGLACCLFPHHAKLPEQEAQLISLVFNLLSHRQAARMTGLSVVVQQHRSV